MNENFFNFLFVSKNNKVSEGTNMLDNGTNVIMQHQYF